MKKPLRRSQSDSQRTTEEVRYEMLGLGIAKLSSVGEMLLDPFKLCLLDAPACTTSVTGYFQGTQRWSRLSEQRCPV